MADLTPNERRALQAAVQQGPEICGLASDRAHTAIWRAARAFENEECAKVCDDEAASHHSASNLAVRTEFGQEIAKAMGCGAMNCAAAIRERAKGLT